MRYATPAAVFCLFLTLGGAKPAHADPLTVGALRGALVDAIARLDTALSNATNNVKAAGNSVEANARGVVSDIDARLGSKLNLTFDRLDDSEKKIFENAQAVVGQVNSAATNIIGKTENAARRILGDADIVAYNALYSLPCRSQVPRVVYSTPEALFEGRSVPEITLRGNYLAIGQEPKVLVDGKPATLLARSANQMRVGVPKSVMNGLQAAHSVSVRFEPEQQSKSCYLFGLVPWSRVKPLGHALTASVLLQPKTRVRVDGSVTPVVLTRQTLDEGHHLDRHDDNCDAHFAVDQTWCLPDGWTFVTPGAYHLTETSANHNCGSGLTGDHVAGDHCVFVGAQVNGCGYNRDPIFHTQLDCRGSGWVVYDVTLHGERSVPADGTAAPVKAQDFVPQRTNFLLHYGGDLAGQTVAGWRYQAKLDFFRGANLAPIRTIEVSDVDPTTGGVSSHLDNGALALDLSQAIEALFEQP
ncbi:MAG TPA: hypothetical protein VGV61_16120 [Thermoanaerobaculia bacterium]|jgi:hypothetical protein|nr:hypothetical protein [Thermoanaerobaculia bacterium]